MKCKKCGSPRAKYVVSRKKHWKGKGKFEEGALPPRTDFRVKCSRCGAEYEDKPEEVKQDEVQETEA